MVDVRCLKKMLMSNKCFNCISLAFISFFSVELLAQVPQLATNKDNNTLLWEVSGKGLAKPSYFLGTMHLLCPEDAYLSPAVLEVLNYSDKIYLEVDMDDMGQMLSGMKNMQMRNGTKLSDLLTEAEMEKVKSYFEGKLPLPFAMVQNFKPMLLLAMVAQQSLPCNAGSGTEMLLMAEAKKLKKSIEGLETLDFQASIFDSIPYADQAKALLEAIADTSDPKKQAMEMVSSYQQQDLDRILKLTEDEHSGMANYLDLFLFKRNRNWVEQFEKLAPGGSYLFAVGAGHLPGKQGVLELLRQKGYTLRPLENKFTRKI
jgi:uncharacterized protein YbaP (TraB family)